MLLFLVFLCKESVVMALIISLIIIGVLLLLVEMLIIPGIGVAGFIGLGSLIGACLIAFSQLGNLGGSIVTLITVCLVAGMLIYALRGKTWKRLSLSESIDSSAIPKEGKVKVGDRGKTITRLSPSGNAAFRENTYEVKSLDNMIEPGTDVEVVMIEDNKIFVKPVS